MKYTKIGKSELNASAIGLGTWAMGGGICWGESNEMDCVNAVHEAIDNGITLIDTAPIYGFGIAEEFVGKAIKTKNRDKLVIATKCGMVWDTNDGVFHYHLDGKDTRICQTAQSIKREVKESLRRLQTDYIDLYQMHWPVKPEDKTPLSESIGAMAELQKEGLIKEIGVSNFSIEQLQEAMKYASIASHQFRYSPLWRDAEAEMLPFCEKNKISTLTYMTLEQGLLTGKIGMEDSFGGGFRKDETWNPFFIPAKRKLVIDMINSWSDLVAKYKCSVSQLVIAYTLLQNGVTHVLAGARKPKNVKENANATDLIIEKSDFDRMRAEFLKINRD